MIQLRSLLEKNRSGIRRKINSGSSSSSSSSSSFDSLPVDCISNIISFTNPEDACVASAVSKTFESAVKSDIVWDKFIPPEYVSLIPPSRVFSSKKELYLSLCHDPLLIDDGKKSIWLEKASGKRCIMLSATAMNLSSTGDNPQRFQWIPSPEARFETVAQLSITFRFEFRCRMNTRFLSPRTRYSVYIVFKKPDGLNSTGSTIKAAVRVVGHGASRRFICFHTRADGKYLRNTVKPEAREDGWMETEFGEFFNEGRLSSDEIEMNVFEREYISSWKSGLIILGIEIRPSKILQEFSVFHY